MLYGLLSSVFGLASLPAHEGTIEITGQAYLSERVAEIAQWHEMTRPFRPPVKIKYLSRLKMWTNTNVACDVIMTAYGP